MDGNRSRLTVFFEEPFWVGLYEREAEGEYEVCKISFGAEPRDTEVYQFLLAQWQKLRFSPPVAADAFLDRTRNPKRLQREAQRRSRVQAWAQRRSRRSNCSRDRQNFCGKRSQKRSARRNRSGNISSGRKNENKSTGDIELLFGDTKDKPLIHC